MGGCIPSKPKHSADDKIGTTTDDEIDDGLFLTKGVAYRRKNIRRTSDGMSVEMTFMERWCKLCTWYKKKRKYAFGTRSKLDVSAYPQVSLLKGNDKQMKINVDRLPSPQILCVTPREDSVWVAIYGAIDAMGYTKHVEEKADKAFNKFQKINYQLVIIDMRFKNFQGLDLCKAIRTLNRSRHTVLVALVQNEFEEIIEMDPTELIRCGFNRIAVETVSHSYWMLEFLQIEKSELALHWILLQNEALTAAVEKCDNLILITTKTHCIQYANKPFRNATGYDPDELIFRPLEQLYGTDNTEQVIRYLDHGFDWTGRIAWKSKQGNAVDFECKAEPFQPYGTVSTNYIYIQQQTSDTAAQQINEASKKDQNDMRLIDSDARRVSLSKLHNLPLEAPITKIITLISRAQEHSSEVVIQLLDRVIDMLQTTDLFSSHMKTDVSKIRDPVTSDLIGALVTSGPSVSSGRRSSRDALVRELSVRGGEATNIAVKDKDSPSTAEITVPQCCSGAKVLVTADINFYPSEGIESITGHSSVFAHERPEDTVKQKTIVSKSSSEKIKAVQVTEDDRPLSLNTSIKMTSNVGSSKYRTVDDILVSESSTTTADEIATSPVAASSRKDFADVIAPVNAAKTDIFTETDDIENDAAETNWSNAIDVQEQVDATDDKTETLKNITVFLQKLMHSEDPNTDEYLRMLNDDTLSKLENSLTWKFDIFEFERVTPGKTLAILGMHIFLEFNIHKVLNCDEKKLFKWLCVMEANYWVTNTYHNSTHAADVMQATAIFLRTERLKKKLDPFDQACCLIAAVTHDIDHPGRSSSFLCNSEDPLAILYNDISVLESHHAAMTFKLTLMENVNIFAGLKHDCYKHARQYIIDMILATEMTKHFEHLTKFVTIFNKQITDEQRELLLQNAASRSPKNKLPEINENNNINAKKNNDVTDEVTLIKRMLIKCADVSNPTRPLKVSIEWTKRIAEEYFAQTDEEKTRNLPVVMPMFDRTICSIPKSQIGFIDFIVSDMFDAWDAFVDIPELIENMDFNYQYWIRMNKEEITSMTQVYSRENLEKLPVLDSTNKVTIERRARKVGINVGSYINQQHRKSETAIDKRELRKTTEENEMKTSTIGKNKKKEVSDKEKARRYSLSCYYNKIKDYKRRESKKDDEQKENMGRIIEKDKSAWRKSSVQILLCNSATSPGASSPSTNSGSGIGGLDSIDYCSQKSSASRGLCSAGTIDGCNLSANNLIEAGPTIGVSGLNKKLSVSINDTKKNNRDNDTSETTANKNN